MEDLLGALMQGGQPAPRPDESSSSEDPMAQLLQGLLGGGGLPQAAGAQPETAGQAAPDLGGLLQGLLGGGGLPGLGAQPETGATQGGLDLGGLLQGVLGGMGGPSGAAEQPPTGGAGGFGDVLGAIMGGGGPATGSSSFLAPIVTGLAEKLGLPPQLAQTVVAFVLGKLLGHRLQPAVSGVVAEPTRATRTRTASLDNVVQTLSSGKRVSKTAVRSTGLAKELSAQTGLDRATAESSLQEVLNMLGGRLQG